MQFPDGTGVGHGHLDEGFHRLDLDDHLVDVNGFARCYPPGDDLRLGQSLTEVG